MSGPGEAPQDDFSAREIERQRTMTHETLLPDPSSGLPFRHAMTWYADQEGGAEYVKLAMRGMIKRSTIGSLTENERSMMLSLRLALKEDQLLRLRYGGQRATAFRPGSLIPEEVPAEWWHLVSVDLDANTAEANGTRLAGILIYPGMAAATAAASHAPRAVDDGQETKQPQKPERRGRRQTVRWPAKQRMLADIDSGKCTYDDLKEMGLEDFAKAYGMKSRDTAAKALEEIRILLMSRNDANSNSDISRQNDI
jgi:hypothetical protein